ncbi:MAG: CHASE domain-containing protein [Desulfobacteraceae bacterium]|jgi:tape measure domain-containing protein
MTAEIDMPIDRTIPLKRYIPATCFFVTGFVLSLIISIASYNWENESSRLQFESHARLMADALTVQLEDNLGALQFLGDFFYNSDDVNRNEFRQFTQGALKRYPAIKALSWNPLVRDKDRRLFEMMAKNQGISSYEIKEMGKDGKLEPSTVREDYVPIYFIEPMSENAKALGFDIASEPVRRNAVLQSFHSGELSATAKINLVQEPGRPSSVLIVVPIYSKNKAIEETEGQFNHLKGFVTEVVELDEVVHKALAAFKDHGLELSLFDKSEDLGDELIISYPEAVPNSPDYFKEKVLTRHFIFAGREWMISIIPAPESMHSYKPWHSRVVLAVLLAFTLMVSYYMYQKMMAGFENELRMKTEIQVNKRLEQEIALREQEEARLRMTHQKLEREIKERISIEKQRDRSILELREALAEVRNLKGILPLCSYCKKIRDDQGSWEQVDVYIHKHSQADISHGICPECMKKHYPEEFKEIYGKGDV